MRLTPRYSGHGKLFAIIRCRGTHSWAGSPADRAWRRRLWRFADFADLPFTPVAQALSRLTRGGTIEGPEQRHVLPPQANGVRQESAESVRDPETGLAPARSFLPARPPPICSASRHRFQSNERLPRAPSACRENSSARTRSSTRAGPRVGMVFPKLMPRCSTS